MYLYNKDKYIPSYFDLKIGVASAQRRPSSLAMSPTAKFGLAALTFGRSSCANQKKADLKY